MKKQILRNQRGQTLIEYLIIVALVGVGSIVLMRSVSQNINARFAKVISALGGAVEGSKSAQPVTEGMYRKRDMRDFAGQTLSRPQSKNSDSENESDSSN